MLRQNVAIFDLDFDAIHAAMYAVTDNAEGDCYLCVPPDPGIEAAALGASASAAPGAGESALSGTAPTTALHTFTLDSADLQDAWVDQFTPGGQRVTHCTCSRMGRHLATFTHWPGSSLYTLTTASPPVTASGQVAASGQVLAAASRSSPVSAPCSCRPLSPETLLWHHCLGHPSLPRLRGMASRTLVSGLPRSLPPLPPGRDPTCVPCVEGRQCAAPHSSEFPPTEAPLQTLHMEVWGPARVSGHGHERYFLLVVDDYSRYTTVFPLRSKGETEVYAAHQINLQPRVSLPETTPTLQWTGKVGDASVFRVWGSQAFVRDTSADKLSSRAVPCVFLGFPPDAPGWQFYHPTSRRVLSSQDVMFDESVSYYRLFPYRTASLPPPPLFLAPGATPVDPLPPQGPAPSGVSQVDPVELVEVAIDPGAARGAEPAGAGTGGAEPGVAESEGAEPGGAEPERVEPGGAEPGGAESGGVEPDRAESGGPPGVPSRREPLLPQRLREWYARRCSRAAGAGAAGGPAGVGAAGAPGPGGAGAGSTGAVGGPAGVGAAGGAGVAGPGGARTGGTGAAGASSATGVGAVGATGAGGVGGAGAVATGGASGAGAVGGTGAGGAAGVVAGDHGAEGTGAVSAVSGGAARPYYVPLLQQCREPASRPALPESHPASPKSRPESPVRAVRAGRRVPCQRPPPLPGTHSMTPLSNIYA
ncbi:unnamed protein product [Closterium sp. NIES-53]